MDKDGLANFFLGLGVGVGLGLLFAPKTGEETREILKNKADEGKEFLKKQTADLRENASGLASDLVEKGRDAISRQRDSPERRDPGGQDRPIGTRWTVTGPEPDSPS